MKTPFAARRPRAPRLQLRRRREPRRSCLPWACASRCTVGDQPAAAGVATARVSPPIRTPSTPYSNTRPRPRRRARLRRLLSGTSAILEDLDLGAWCRTWATGSAASLFVADHEQYSCRQNGEAARSTTAPRRPTSPRAVGLRDEQPALDRARAPTTIVLGLRAQRVQKSRRRAPRRGGGDRDQRREASRRGHHPSAFASTSARRTLLARRAVSTSMDLRGRRAVPRCRRDHRGERDAARRAPPRGEAGRSTTNDQGVCAAPR